MRSRHVLIGIGSLLVIGGLLATDPDHGVVTGLGLLSLASGVIGVAMAHLSRKGLFDYLNLEALSKKAAETSQGSGIVFLGVCIVLAALLLAFAPRARAQVPPQALQHLPTLAKEITAYWPEVPMREYVPALIEHESCITLKHSRCWSPTARLKTQREEGAGLGQITRAYRADGSLRFDALADLRQRHPALSGLAWDTIYSRPDLQMRALVLMSRSNWDSLRKISTPLERLAMTDSAYNGGIGGVQQDRRACQATRGCDPQRWWGHVERTCTKSLAALYAGRSACDINRHHVADVIRTRAPKYRGMV